MTWSPNGGARERATADALDRFWDALTVAHPGGPSPADEPLDRGLTRSVRRLHVTEAAARPDPVFAARLRGELMAASPEPAVAPPPIAAGVGGRLIVWPRHRMLVELAVVAALLVVILGGGAGSSLPVSLAPVSPTAAAGGQSPAGFGGGLACAPTVTPMPTHAVSGTTTALTTPVPTAPARRTAMC